LLYIGGAVLAWTAARMIVGEPLVEEELAARPGFVTAIYVAVIGGVLGLAWAQKRRPQKAKEVLQ
jgi:hypothetical protein